MRDDTAGRAPHKCRLGLHLDHKPAAVVALNSDQMQRVQADEGRRQRDLLPASRSEDHELAEAL